MSVLLCTIIFYANHCSQFDSLPLTSLTIPGAFQSPARRSPGVSGAPSRVYTSALPFGSSAAASAASTKRKRVVRPQECSKVCDDGDEDPASARAAPRAKHARMSLTSLVSPPGGDEGALLGAAASSGGGGGGGGGLRARAQRVGGSPGECSLFTVTFYANYAHNLTRSP